MYGKFFHVKSLVRAS